MFVLDAQIDLFLFFFGFTYLCYGINSIRMYMWFCFSYFFFHLLSLFFFSVITHIKQLAIIFMSAVWLNEYCRTLEAIILHSSRLLKRFFLTNIFFSPFLFAMPSKSHLTNIPECKSAFITPTINWILERKKKIVSDVIIKENHAIFSAYKMCLEEE